jgi:DNA-binding transcriptional LysR family regulator
VFCDIASLRSFSKAAKANGLTQPAVSRIVHQLEERLGGVKLIDRSKRPLQLTALGQTYYEGCKDLLERYAELEASILRSRPQMTLTIRVAAIYSVGLGDMGQYVLRYEAQQPHVQVRIDYVHPNQVYQRVLDGTADFGLVSFPAKSRELTSLPWREEEMVVACSPAHRLAGGSTILPTQLDGEKFVTFDRGLVIRREVDRFLREHGVTVEVTLELDNIESMKKGIEANAGLSLLPEPMLRQEVQAGTIRALRLEGCRLVRPLGIIHRRHHRLGSAVLGFIEFLRANGGANGNGAAAHPVLQTNGCHFEEQPPTTSRAQPFGTSPPRIKSKGPV